MYRKSNASCLLNTSTTKTLDQKNAVTLLLFKIRIKTKKGNSQALVPIPVQLDSILNQIGTGAVVKLLGLLLTITIT